MKVANYSLALVLLAASCSTQGESQDANISQPARFRITDQVVNHGLEAFTATIGGFGNNLMWRGSGFEPVIYRNRYSALTDAADRVSINADRLTHYDTLRDGVLDGAEVQVYRIENGQFQIIRQAKIPEGGFRASGWLPLIDKGHVIPVGHTQYDFEWAAWSRLGVPYYFTVRAITRAGVMSAPSPAYAIERPTQVRRVTPNNPTTSFRAPIKESDANGTPPAPSRLEGAIDHNGMLTLRWDAVQAHDIAGYLVYVSDYPPVAQRGYGIDLTPSATSEREHIRIGDMVVVSKKFYTASRNRFHSNRVWGAQSENWLFMPPMLNFFPDEKEDRTWELLAHESDSPVTESGETYLRLTLRHGNRQSVAIYNNSGTSQDWYPVLETKPYKVEVWLRGNKPGKVEFKLGGYHDKPGRRIAPISFRVGPQWKKYEATFTPRVIQDTDEPNQMALVFTGPGTFDVDNFRVYRADTDYNDYLPEEYEQLKAAGLSSLRTHAFIKTQFRTYDMDQLTNPAGVIDGSTKLNTLPQTLAMMRKAGVRPWLQIEPHMNPNEWLGLVEYLAAPYKPGLNQPWARKRHQQGQVRPWAEEFDRIYFEVGNETWNQLFSPWIFGQMRDSATGLLYSPGQVYGLYQEFVIRTLRSSPYWKPAGLENKVVFVLGGWNGMPYGMDAASFSPSSDYMTVAAYNGGWDEGEGPANTSPSGLFNILNQVSQAAIPNAELHAKEVAGLNGKNRSSPLGLGTYEAGPGYAMNGLNGARMNETQVQEQEQAMKSQAAGTATIDSFLARAYRGFDLQNFFVFGPGPYWTSHAKWHKGGHAYPSWKQIDLFNNHATGDMLRTETLSVPSVNLMAFDRRRQIKNAPLVAAYATRKGDRYSVYVISRKVAGYPEAGDAGYTPVTLDLPCRKVDSITLHRMAGEPVANNVAYDNVRIETTELPAQRFKPKFMLDESTGAHADGIEPGAAYLYLFGGCQPKRVPPRR